MNIYKHHGAFKYDALGVYNAPTMMRIENQPNCLVLVTFRNAPMHDRKNELSEFQIIHTHLALKKWVFIKV